MTDLNPILKIGDVEVNTVHRYVSYENETVQLTHKECRVLICIMDKQERVVTREQILQEVWGGNHVHPRTIDVHLCTLKKKIPQKLASRIQLIFGTGYRYKAEAAS